MEAKAIGSHALSSHKANGQKAFLDSAKIWHDTCARVLPFPSAYRTCSWSCFVLIPSGTKWMKLKSCPASKARSENNLNNCGQIVSETVLLHDSVKGQTQALVKLLLQGWQAGQCILFRPAAIVFEGYHWTFISTFQPNHLSYAFMLQTCLTAHKNHTKFTQSLWPLHVILSFCHSIIRSSESFASRGASAGNFGSVLPAVAVLLLHLLCHLGIPMALGHLHR